MPKDLSTLKRDIHPVPSDVLEAMEKAKVYDLYRDRPAYQQNDYISWITGAKRPETRQKRLDQMLEELKRGGVYMKMNGNPESLES